MPTVITHAAVPLCLGLGLGTKVIPPRLLFAGIVLAMLPDADLFYPNQRYCFFSLHRLCRWLPC